MSELAGARREFGEGPLARAAALIYHLLVVEVLLVLTSVPALIPLALLDHDVSNLPLAGLCALPVGPSLSAALYALHHRRADLTDLRPLAMFWRGYTLNARAVVPVWLPLVGWLTLIAVSLGDLADAAVPRWWAVLLVVVAVGVLMWGGNAMVIVSLFAFRSRDVARLAAYFLVRTPGVTVANACLLIAAAGVVVISSEALLALFSSVLALLLLRGSRPMVALIRAEFTVPGELP